MATIGIFSVKVFVKYRGEYFTNGGFGEYLSDMCRSFDGVTLCCKVRKGKPPKGFYRVIHPNLTVAEVPLWPTELGAIALQPLVVAKGLSFVRNVDVVHARMPDWFGISGTLVARLLGKPCFHQIIADWHAQARLIPWSKRFGLGLGLKGALYVYDRLERLVSRGQLVFAQGEVAYLKHSKHSCAHLVLSSAHRDSEIGTVTDRCIDSLSVLAVGRLDSVKNHALLIRAIHELRKIDPRWHLSIIGEGGQRVSLERLIAELGISDGVHLLGGVAHGDLWRCYDQADMFVLPSLSEGTPKVILEAMARGCPVIASKISGIPTAVEHERRGLLFESGNLSELIQSMTRMADDAALRSRCQREALEFARLHTVEATTRFMTNKVLERWPHLSPLRHGHA